MPVGQDRAYRGVSPGLAPDGRRPDGATDGWDASDDPEAEIAIGFGRGLDDAFAQDPVVDDPSWRTAFQVQDEPFQDGNNPLDRRERQDDHTAFSIVSPDETWIEPARHGIAGARFGSRIDAAPHRPGVTGIGAPRGPSGSQFSVARDPLAPAGSRQGERFTDDPERGDSRDRGPPLMPESWNLHTGSDARAEPSRPGTVELDQHGADLRHDTLAVPGESDSRVRVASARGARRADELSADHARHGGSAASIDALAVDLPGFSERPRHGLRGDGDGGQPPASRHDEAVAAVPDQGALAAPTETAIGPPEQPLSGHIDGGSSEIDGALVDSTDVMGDGRSTLSGRDQRAGGPSIGIEPLAASVLATRARFIGGRARSMGGSGRVLTGVIVLYAIVAAGVGSLAYFELVPGLSAGAPKVDSGTAAGARRDEPAGAIVSPSPPIPSPPRDDPGQDPGVSEPVQATPDTPAASQPEPPVTANPGSSQAPDAAPAPPSQADGPAGAVDQPASKAEGALPLSGATPGDPMPGLRMQDRQHPPAPERPEPVRSTRTNPPSRAPAPVRSNQREANDRRTTPAPEKDRGPRRRRDTAVGGDQARRISPSLAYGERLLASGQILAARRAFETAAAAGDPNGARGIARTFDQKVISQHSETDVAPDPEKSALWNQLADELAARQRRAQTTRPEGGR